MDNIGKNLQRISTYAREHDITVAGVYKRIEAGKVKVVEIDGVKFIEKEEDGSDEDRD